MVHVDAFLVMRRLFHKLVFREVHAWGKFSGALSLFVLWFHCLFLAYSQEPPLTQKAKNRDLKSRLKKELKPKTAPFPVTSEDCSQKLWLF